MANLSRMRWERYVPDLGANRSLPEAERLELEVSSGLSAAQLDEAREALNLKGLKPTEWPPIIESVLGKYVRLKGSHTIDGAQVTNLRQYLDAVACFADGYPLLEMMRVVFEANDFGGRDELFSARRSGGWVSTRLRVAAETTGDR